MDLTSLSDYLLDMALSPALLLGVLIALVFSLLFYGWRGGGIGQMGRDLVAGVAGFGAGQLLGSFLALNALRLGQLQVLAGVVGAICALFAGRRLRSGKGKKQK